MKQRITYIDQLKGIAIILVVIGHFIQYNTIAAKDSGLFSFIYSFHMPLFMFISGYVAFKTTKVTIFESYGNFLLKKARSLLVPFFAWPLIVDNFVFRSDLNFDFYNRALLLLADPRIGLWFLWYLFFLTVIFSAFLFLSMRFNRKNKLFFDATICIFLSLFLLLVKFLGNLIYIDGFIQYFGYFFLGVFLAKYSAIRDRILNVNYFSLLFVIFLVAVGHYSFNDKNFHMFGVSLLIKVVAATTAIFSLYYIVNNIKWIPVIDSYITSWGVSSIVIYATHFKFIEIFKGIGLLPEMHVLLLLVISLLFSLLVVSFCMFIYRIVKLCPPLNFLLYGQKLEFYINKIK